MLKVRSSSKDGYCPTADHCEIFELAVESRIFRLRTQMSRVPPKPPSITAASYQPQEETFIPYSYEIGGSIYLNLRFLKVRWRNLGRKFPPREVSTLYRNELPPFYACSYTAGWR